MATKSRTSSVYDHLFHRETIAQYGELCRYVHRQWQKSLGRKLKSFPFKCSQIRWAFRAASADQHQVHVAALDSQGFRHVVVKDPAVLDLHPADAQIDKSFGIHFLSGSGTSRQPQIHGAVAFDSDVDQRALDVELVERDFAAPT